MQAAWLNKAAVAVISLSLIFVAFVVVDTLGDDPSTESVQTINDPQEQAAVRPTLSVEANSQLLVAGQETEGESSTELEPADDSAATDSAPDEGAADQPANESSANGDDAAQATDGNNNSGENSGRGESGSDASTKTDTNSGGANATSSGANSAAGGSSARGSVAEVGPLPASAFEPIRNNQAQFSTYASTPSDQLSLNALTVAAPVNDNGASGLGEFRVACEYSHFSYDDPIVFPDQPGRSHLHMFFGNTKVDAFTKTNDLVNSGGGSCDGFELNRSGYWTPALLDGRGHIVVPDQIIVYYKTHRTQDVQPMPQGLTMIAGNTGKETFSADYRLLWSCGPSGTSYNMSNHIPDCGGDVINAGIKFPDCWDGVNLTSSDFTSHMTYGTDNAPCPASHPVRLPQITILLYYPGTDSVAGWKLSSDDTGGYNGAPGGSLHADWWGGWNNETMDLWVNKCLRAKRNCSYGQTGTPRQLAPLNPLQTYAGDNYLPLPSPR